LSMHVAPIYLQHTPRFGACQALARIFLQRVRCSRNGVTEWHANNAESLWSVFGLFSGSFRVVCEAFANADRGVPDGDTHAREREAQVWDPFCATFLNPTPPLSARCR